MYQSILVPLDGSTFAEYALPVAQSIAYRSKATLQLVHVHIPLPVGYPEGVVVFNEGLETQNKEYERTYLQEVTKRLAAGLNVQVTSALLDGRGTIAETLNHYVKATGTDLIVMATHGRGALTRFWLGSVADQLVRQAERPLLLVRPPEGAEAPPNLVQEQVFQHILIPLDGSALSEQILEHAIALGELMHADYTLLRVVDLSMLPSYPPTSYIGLDRQLLEELQAKAQTYLDSVANRLRAQVGTPSQAPLQIQTRVVVHQQPAVAILEEAGKDGIDLVAMETHGWGGLTRLFVGSIADKVLRGAPKPVLIHRPQSKSP